MKEYLRQLIAGGKTEEALQQLLKVSKQLKDQALYNEVIQQSSKYEQYARAKRQGTSSMEDQKISLARINQALLEIIPQLPHQSKIAGETDNNGATKKTSGRPLWQWIVSAGVVIGILGSLAEVLNFIDLFPLKHSNGNLQLTVFVTDTNGNVALENEGRLNIPLGNRSLNEIIGANGRTNFPDITANNRGDTILIGLDAEGWEIAGGVNTFVFTGEPIQLKVKRAKSLGRITGLIKDKNGLGLAGATVLIGADTAVQTDNLGRFVLNMPEHKIQTSYELTIQKEGYKSKSRTYVPNSNLFELELEKIKNQ